MPCASASRASLLTHPLLGTPALGDVGGDPAHGVNAALAVAQRELVRDVRMLAVRLGSVSSKRDVPPLASTATSWARCTAASSGEKNSTRVLPDQSVAVDTQDALELPVAEQQTPFAVVHVDHDRRVVENAPQARSSTSPVARSRRRAGLLRRTVDSRRAGLAASCRLVPTRLARGCHARSSPGGGTCSRAAVRPDPHAVAHEYRAPAPTGCPRRESAQD